MGVTSELKVAGAMGVDEIDQKVCGVGTKGSRDRALGDPEGRTKGKARVAMKKEPEASREGEMQIK